MLRPIPSPMRPGAERRREKRYQVDLPGVARCDRPAGEADVPVVVSDLSASGGLITTSGDVDGFAKGDCLLLVLEDFGEIEARVVHVGNGFYGLSFVNPHLHRDRLTAWLREDVAGA